MLIARHFTVHSGFDHERPLSTGESEHFAHNQLALALATYEDAVKHAPHENHRLTADFLDDWQEMNTIILAFHNIDVPTFHLPVDHKCEDEEA